VRAHISRGEVYQANICRVLRTPCAGDADVVALHHLLVAGNPAPHAGALRLPDHGVHIASASPELYLRRAGDTIESRPIKGTGRRAGDLLAKDEAENVMIVDLVRNDLGRICRTGSIGVPGMLEVEHHPGLVHLVSTVSGELLPGTLWPQILAATFPPGSVTGAPKIAALGIIDALEAGPRGPYCGAFGWVDADRASAELAVAIRTFWREDGPTGAQMAFGTGAGITWASDPQAEWRETQLKSARLLAVAGIGEVP
jgi:para-aminobenzoate synthetase component 1